MEISKRLKIVSDMVLFDTVADIGTDHGYVPIYLSQKGKIKKAIACDINKGPLENAEKNIARYGFSDIISVRLSNGLEKINPFEVETIVIAGMGGMLITEILEKSLDVTKSSKQLVLQPQLDVYCVRKAVHKLGFKIVLEEMIFEDGIYYNILSCEKGIEKYNFEFEYLFGKVLIEKKSEVLKEFIENKIKLNNKIIENLKNAKTENSEAKLKTLNEENKVCLEVCKCL